MVNHGHADYKYSKEELRELYENIRDRNYRIVVNNDGVNLFNKNTFITAIDPYDFYESLDVKDDPGHAFYLGLELSRAQIAYQLGKEYEQDQELEWGCIVDKEDDDKMKTKELGPTFKKK